VRQALEVSDEPFTNRNALSIGIQSHTVVFYYLENYEDQGRLSFHRATNNYKG